MLCDTLSTNIAITFFYFVFLKSVYESINSLVLLKDAVSLCVAWLDVRWLSSRGLVRGGRWEAWDRETTHSIGRPLTFPLCVAVYDVFLWCVVVMAELWSGLVSTLVPLCSVSIRDRKAFAAESSAVQLHRVLSSCHGRRSQCDPENMGENITIFFKKGNLLIH